MQRRTLLRIGLGSAALVAIAGGSIALIRPGLQDDHLSARGRDVFAAIARGVLPAQLSMTPLDVAEHVARVDLVVAGLCPPTRSDLSDLLGLLSVAPGRMAMTGLARDWPEVTSAEVRDALQSMRMSTIALRAQAYQALRDLTLAAHYARPHAWHAMGYPGPMPIG